MNVGAIAKELGIEGFPLGIIKTATETAELETWFRNHQEDLGAWLLVIRWKMASQGGRGKPLAENVSNYWNRDSIEGIILSNACDEYIRQGDISSFRAFFKLFPFKDRIAVVATFPAFVAPQRFGMVDTRVAKWAIENGSLHGLRPPPSYGRTSQTSLSMADFPFVEEWQLWCREQAKKLGWRARDVEMAVFRAWGNRHPIDSINLEVL